MKHKKRFFFFVTMKGAKEALMADGKYIDGRGLCTETYKDEFFSELESTWSENQKEVWHSFVPNKDFFLLKLIKNNGYKEVYLYMIEKYLQHKLKARVEVFFHWTDDPNEPLWVSFRKKQRKTVNIPEPITRKTFRIEDITEEKLKAKREEIFWKFMPFDANLGAKMLKETDKIREVKKTLPEGALALTLPYPFKRVELVEKGAGDGNDL